MEEKEDLLNNLGHIKDFERIYTGLASPEKIRSWSYGEVKTPETINYRTFKPEHNGLFCARTFGPVKDYQCLCGKHKLFNHQGVICEKCGVEVTKTSVRRSRMGHIELATPVVHIWYFKSLPSRIGLLLDMSLRDLERVLYFEAYVVIEPGLTSLKRGQLLSETAYLEAFKKHGHQFDARMGGEAIYELLHSLDLESLKSKLHQQLELANSQVLKKKLKKRLMLIQTFLHSSNQPQWMVLKVLPVLPPDLRPLVPIDIGRFATSDLNELYRRVINRNNRAKRLLESNAPDVVIRNEMRMLQEAVDALLDNGRRHRPFTRTNKQALHSLSDLIKGKQGRFRQNLLGKRVDYSGRSVIIIGPLLKLHQCGLPKEMALELFKPYVIHELQKRGLAVSIKVAKRLIEQKKIPLIWEVLEEVIKFHPVLLNRIPTLYRLGIQAFEPVLIEGKAIQLHPLVCKVFNAHFDGDQMAVHIPLSIEAQLEARVLMMSNRNIRSPINGKLLIVPCEEMVLGLYLMTQERTKVRGEGMVFADIFEVQRAYNDNVVDLQTVIEVRLSRFKYFGPQKEIQHSKTLTHKLRVKTTVGRVLLAENLPVSMPFELINRCLTHKILSELLNFCYRRFGLFDTIRFANKLMHLGFTYATRSGFTLSIEDLAIPEQKSNLMNETKAKVDKIQKQYLKGLITNGQRYNKIIDIWTKIHHKIEQMVLNHLSDSHSQNSLPSSAILNVSKKEVLKTIDYGNALYIMIDAGVRSLKQICQLSGMYGLTTKQDGSIIETPITANFREGLDVHQYFLTTNSIRKGLADSALKIANAGYLTRRLVDVAQDVIVVEQDCGTTEGLILTALSKNNQIIESLNERVLGRVVAKSIRLSGQKKPLIKVGTLLDEDAVELLEQYGINQVKVRSPITCQSQHGICAMCYGRDLARSKLVNIAEAIGVVAAQSIGESGNKLTLTTPRTTDNILKKETIINQIEVSFKGLVKFHHLKLIQQQVNGTQKSKQKLSTSNPQFIIVSRDSEISIVDESGIEQERHKVPYGAILSVNEGEPVNVGQQIAYWEPHTYPVITEFAGYIRFTDIKQGVTVTQEIDESTEQSIIVVNYPKQRPPHAKDLRPMLKLVDKFNNDLKFVDSEQPITYILPPNAIINVKDGAKVNIGDVIARLPQNLSKNRGIANDLPRVIDLFEARIPKEPAILALRSGTISLGKETKTKHRFIITDKAGQQDELSILKWRPTTILVGQQVQLGEVIVDGDRNPHDILHLEGIEALAKSLVNEMQEIYLSHGIKINDKHFEVIIRQMLRTVTIVEAGDTPFLKGDVVLLSRLQEENQRITTQTNKPATWTPKLLGITKASLATESFISAASFMDTARVLLASAVSGKRDELRGLKENVIIGRSIPAGTGLASHKNRRHPI